MLTGTQAAGHRAMAFLAKPWHRAKGKAGVLPYHHSGPRLASAAPSPAARPWGGVGFAQRGSSTELWLWQGCAGITLSPGARRPSRQSLASRL